MAAVLLVLLAVLKAQAVDQAACGCLGLSLQFLFAFLVLKTPVKGWSKRRARVNALLGYAAAGSSFVFGDKLAAPRL